jgi:hypothetical protein
MPVAARPRTTNKKSRHKSPKQNCRVRTADGRALDHAVRIIYRVCCLAGAPDLIDEIREELRAEGIPAGIRRHDTAVLFDWLMTALSYQGISDRVAFNYMKAHGQAKWHDIEAKLGHGSTCPKLQSYWHYHGCRYDKISRTCAEPDHVARCPVPSHDLRNGRLNQTAYSLYLFIRDVADGDLVGWIDRQFREADWPHDADRPGRLRAALIEPLREVYGVSDKVLTMTLSCVLLAAPRGYETWRQVGASMIAIDTLWCTTFCTGPGSWPGSGPTISMALAATKLAAAPTLLLWPPSGLMRAPLTRPSRPFSRGSCSMPSGGIAPSSAWQSATAIASMIVSRALTSTVRFAGFVIVLRCIKLHKFNGLRLLFAIDLPAKSA